MIKHNLVKEISLGIASLLMISSLGTGINNVSARRVQKYHPRIHRTTMTPKRLYKLAYHQSSSYISLLSLPFESDKPVSKSFGSRVSRARQSLINNIIKYHFNKSYIHGLYPLNTGHNFGEENNKNGMVQSAKRYAKKINHKNVHKHAIKRTRRHYKKHKSTKSIKRNKRNNHIRRIKKYRKYTKTRHKHHLHKFNKHINKKSTKKVSTLKETSNKIPFMDIALGNGVNKVTPKIKSIFAKQTQIEMLKDINLARSKSGLKPLTFSNELTSQANKDANDYMKSDSIDSTYGAIGVNPNNASENLLQSTLINVDLSDPSGNHDMDTNSYSFDGKSEHGDSDNDGMSYLNDNGTDDADEDMDNIFSDNAHDEYEDEGLSDMKNNVLNPNSTSVGIGTADNYSNNNNNGYGQIFVAQLFN